MDKRPIRRRYKDNPYELIINNNLYLIKFLDSKRKLQVIEVSYEVFKVFDNYELQDLKQLNEYDRHIEHSKIYENNLELRSKYKALSVEDEIIRKRTIEELKKAIDLLSEIQKRRVKMYYFENKTFEEIAKIEKISRQNVHKSIGIAIEKLKKNLKI